MSWRISILDKSPIAENETAADALARTLALAQQAENLGYHRFWIAEHHNTPQLASPSPELLIAWILGQTTRIRVGSGGVMLQHYSPYKVAENFNVLAALAPGRVDLGVGKAPGGLPLSTRALQLGLDQQEKGSFAEQLAQLDRWIRPENHSAEEAVRAAGTCTGFSAGRQHGKRAARRITRLALCLCRASERRSGTVTRGGFDLA